jgi:protease-4
MSEYNSNWEREVLGKLAMAAIQEQRRARKWGIFFKSLTFVYLFIVLIMLSGWRHGEPESALAGKHTALVELNGEIAADKPANADNIIEALQRAFKDKNTQGVILRINSPGGSPVQAGAINDEMRRLRQKYPSIPLYVVVEDMCASGGYYVAAAADKIYVNKASLVGSIGVLMNGFGFTGTMAKLGVDRRLLTAGVNKGFLDPFSPPNAKQNAIAQKMLDEIHGQFIAVVREGRGKRLKETPEMFSGLVWTGQQSIELGLADGLGSVESVARDVIKADKIVDYTTHEGLAERLAKRFGAGVASEFTGFSTESHIILR